MDLCFAVFACNQVKVARIVRENFDSLKMGFKNMKDRGATVMFYAIKENNYDLLQSVYEAKKDFLNEFISDDMDIDYPIYFKALTLNLDNRCLKLITPKADLVQLNKVDISHLYYKGMSLLRYALEINLNISTLKDLLQAENSSKELITVRDPDYLTCKEVAIKNGKQDYLEMIENITVDYILNEKHLRKQLAFNGYDFSNQNLKYEGVGIYEYAKSKDLHEIYSFLDNVDNYQKKIDEFHDAAEKNDYNLVKNLYKANMRLKDETHFKSEDLFELNLLNSRKRNESQHILHKAVLNGYYHIIELLLDLMIEEPQKLSIKFDSIRDHCQRTPIHYANGYTDNKRITLLLSQFGFSDNVYDKDGMTPVDFQERNSSQELQDLMKIHKLKKFSVKEPDPWSWKVWTKIQRERNTLKQLISVSHPHLHSHSHSHDHGNCQGDEYHSHAASPLKKNETIHEVEATDQSMTQNVLNCVLL